MSNNLEITRDTVKDFVDIQRYMLTAKEEHADRTYQQLLEKYHSLKAILTVAGVNLTSIDVINE